MIAVNFNEFGIPQLDEQCFLDALMTAKPKDAEFFRELISAEKGSVSWPEW